MNEFLRKDPDGEAPAWPSEREVKAEVEGGDEGPEELPSLESVLAPDAEERCKGRRLAL